MPTITITTTNPYGDLTMFRALRLVTRAMRHYTWQMDDTRIRAYSRNHYWAMCPITAAWHHQYGYEKPISDWIEVAAKLRIDPGLAQLIATAADETRYTPLQRRLRSILASAAKLDPP